MKMIEAIVKPSRFDAVKDALDKAGVGGITVINGMGFGKQRGFSEVYRGIVVEAGFIPKIILQIVVDDDMVDRVVQLIIENARTGKVGDGKNFILPVENVVRIRTGESGTEAV
jgi:nitrogen regulatory protein P-II 1